MGTSPHFGRTAACNLAPFTPRQRLTAACGPRGVGQQNRPGPVHRGRRAIVMGRSDRRAICDAVMRRRVQVVFFVQVIFFPEFLAPRLLLNKRGIVLRGRQRMMLR